jgi:hypothetical protein
MWMLIVLLSTSAVPLCGPVCLLHCCGVQASPELTKHDLPLIHC